MQTFGVRFVYLIFSDRKRSDIVYCPSEPFNFSSGIIKHIQILVPASLRPALKSSWRNRSNGGITAVLYVLTVALVLTL